VEIEDTGVGIQTDQLAAIFEPFHQIHGPKRRSEGTGLGLSISRKLVTLMGGTMDVSSTVGEGSTFTVEVPAPTVLSVGSPLDPSRRIIGFEGSAKRIMVVDDRAANRSVLCDLLGPLGFEIDEAENGEVALMRANEHPPDAFLMDLVMPVMDGFEATRVIRKSDRLKDLVVIALSASVFERSRQNSLQAGCQDFVSKPVRADQLLEKLGEHLNLTWIYAQQEDPASVALSSAPREAEVVVPDEPHVRLLYEHALRGDINAIRRQLGVIERIDNRFGPFVSTVRRMADDYDMRQINDFVKPFLGDDEKHESGN
jgi:CheY-like chemotaxis protein